MNDFYLFANCNFVPDRYSDWQAAYDDLATYVYANEPTTKSYYFGIPIDYAHDFSKTTSMFAFEVYNAREDFYNTHLASPAMSTFLNRIPAASTTGLDLNHYKLVAGFLDPDGRKTEAQIMHDQRIVCTSPTSRTCLLSSLSSLVNSVEKAERESNSGGGEGVLTYMAFASEDDGASARIYGRWRTREDMERFIRRQDVIAFWMDNKDHVKSMEQRCYVPNGKGWLHRGQGYAGERLQRADSKTEMSRG